VSGDREKSLAAGMNDHLTKPISPDHLTGALLSSVSERPQPSDSLSAPEVAALAQEDDSLPEELLPFNLRVAMMRTNEKPKLLRKMMLSFRNLYSEVGPELRLLLNHGRMKEAERIVHSLKESALRLEARQLGDAAEAIEVALRSGATHGLQALISEMEEALTPAIAAAATLDTRVLTADSAESSLEKSGGTILIVDDDPAYLELLTDIFFKEYRVFSATRGMDAVAIATAVVPDVILLDVMMPGLDGYEVCRLLKNEQVTCDIPLIFLTSLGDVANESKALAMGAVDYVTKPINPPAVKARVNHQIQLKRAHDRLMQLAVEDLLAQLRRDGERAKETERINKHELELRDHFLSHVSHELRSPLTAIHSFSTIIADGLAGATTPQQDEYLDIIGRNVSQLNAMIEDLLLVTAAKTGNLDLHLQSASLFTAIVDAINTLQGSSVLKGVELSSSVNEDLAAYADPVRLLQVLIILCDNAIKFTPSGGKVKVEAHPFVADPNFLLVEVSDTGCGIQPDMTERIFERLYQISDVSDDAGRAGLGLGLHIARELITRHGGKIWAEALPTAGSRFSFTVPVLRKEDYTPA
jgi:signal transduction histidine kinase/HPt (histidine-containing phosphotransfer) domain-containing protein